MDFPAETKTYGTSKGAWELACRPWLEQPAGKGGNQMHDLPLLNVIIARIKTASGVGFIISGQFRLEGVSGGHLIQPPAQSRVSYGVRAVC